MNQWQTQNNSLVFWQVEGGGDELEGAPLKVLAYNLGKYYIKIRKSLDTRYLSKQTNGGLRMLVQCFDKLRGEEVSWKVHLGHEG